MPKGQNPKSHHFKPGNQLGVKFKPGNPYGRKFQPGVSGNPAGRPKNQVESAEYIAKRLREEFLDRAIDELMDRAMNGSAAHMIEALNRVAGKVTDRVSGSIDHHVELEGRVDFSASMRRILELEATPNLLPKPESERDHATGGGDPGSEDDPPADGGGQQGPDQVC